MRSLKSEYKITVHDNKTNTTGFLVLHNTNLGPGKGGLRMTPNTSLKEVERLAETMTWKNALAGLPFGGAKAGIKWNGDNKKDKERAVKSFTKKLSRFLGEDYITAPDVNTGEEEMKWIAEEAGNNNVVTGKPESLGGLPHELGSTGFGVAQSTKAIVELTDKNLEGLSVAIDGFGNVGRFAAKHLKEWGSNIVGVSDSSGAIINKKGLKVEKLTNLKKQGRSVVGYEGGEAKDNTDIFEQDVDVLITASVTDVIHQDNKDNIKADIIVEGSNIPMKTKIEKDLHAKGVVVVPDFIANAGGVISSYAEYKNIGEDKMFDMIEEKITNSTKKVLSKSLENGETPRDIALKIAKEKVL